MARATGGTELDRLAVSWRRSLRAANRSEKTIDAYLAAVEQLSAYLVQHRHSGDLADVTRGDVEGFIGNLLDTRSASTAATRYRGLQQFFKWATDEEELERSPMTGMRPPKLEQTTVPVIAPADLKALLKVCEGKGFEQRRDRAILSVFIDTGARLSEVANLRVGDVDLDTPRREVAYVVGKGRKHRAIPLGAATVRDIDRYLRVRTRHPMAGAEALWIGQKGAMTDSGLAQMLRRRCRQVGIPALHWHQFRHSFALPS